MARSRSITAAALNVRIHPHNAELYAQLFNDAFRLRRPIRVFGNQQIIIQSIENGTAQEGYITGLLARFTEIDPNLPWFNAVKFERADDNDVAKVSIPNELRPNYVSLFFRFSLQAHLFIFEHRGPNGSLSPRSALSFLEKLLNSDEITRKYGSVAVSLVSDRNQLEEVIGLFRLRRLEILVKRPNDDDHGSYDEDMEKRLVGQGAKSVRVEYEANSNETIAPDKNTLDLASSATRNGWVKATGNDSNGRSIKNSTEDHPLLEVE